MAILFQVFRTVADAVKEGWQLFQSCSNNSGQFIGHRYSLTYAAILVNNLLATCTGFPRPQICIQMKLPKVPMLWDRWRDNSGVSVTHAAIMVFSLNATDLQYATIAGSNLLANQNSRQFSGHRVLCDFPIWYTGTIHWLLWQPHEALFIGHLIGFARQQF